MWKLWDVAPAVPAVSKGRSQAVTPCRRSSKLISHICAEPLRGTKGIIGQVRVWNVEAARSSAFLKFLGIYSLDIERDPDWFWIHPRSSVLEQELGLENMNLTLPLETRSLGATNIAMNIPGSTDQNTRRTQAVLLRLSFEDTLRLTTPSPFYSHFLFSSLLTSVSLNVPLNPHFMSQSWTQPHEAIHTALLELILSNTAAASPAA